MKIPWKLDVDVENCFFEVWSKIPTMCRNWRYWRLERRIFWATESATKNLVLKSQRMLKVEDESKATLSDLWLIYTKKERIPRF